MTRMMATLQDTMAAAETAPKGTLLLVDDEPLLLRAFARVLKLRGYVVEGVPDGESALAQLQQGKRYDAMFCDLSLPGANGLTILRQVRELDPELPIILMTGSPSLETAIDAVSAGATRYLVKPIESHLLEAAAAEAVTRRRAADDRRRAQEEPDREAEAELLDRALATMHMAYQPIVRFSRREIYAYEALLRTQGSGLPHAGALVDLAQRCGRLAELGRRIRAAVAAAAPNAGQARLFVNLHPADLLDEELYQPSSPLSLHARRVVLEVTERAGLDEIPELSARLRSLRALGYRIAVDDLGEGYAGLTSLARLEPQFVKLDMSLVRNIDQSPCAQHIVRSTVMLCRELDSRVIAEGVETAGERDALLALGCDLLQGYLLARPSPPFCTANFA
jgi:EAL domain-containing protein (putative c-di-GMP-specific phosphodiesterase class I)